MHIILLAISSDFCSLLSTLLLTLRCYDIIKNRTKFFDKGNNEILFIILDIFISILLGIGFLFLDRLITIKINNYNISYRYDVRDRCSYWCWIEHYSSFVCIAFYVGILISIMVYALRTYSILKEEYNKLKKENQLSDGYYIDNLGIQSIGEEKEEKKKFVNLIKEDKERLQNLKLLRIKNLVYPLVTIIYWTFAVI